MSVRIRSARVPGERSRDGSVAPGATSNRRHVGAGRVLVAVYAVLALAATGRSFVQIVRRFDEAPVAFSLSALAAVVYIVATLALARRSERWRSIALAAVCFELLGVVVVGTLSITHPELFAHDSVWSHFGSGYLFIPAVLPLLGLWWLAASRPRRDAGAAA